MFVRLWLAHTPTLPGDAKPTARSTAESRYKQFVEHVVQQFSGGRRFLDDLPHEVVVDGAERDAIADKSTSSPDKSDNRKGEHEAGNDGADRGPPRRA